MNNGELALNNMNGNFFMREGLGIGIMDPAANTPAFPWDAPDAGPNRSTIITRYPALCNQIAEEIPTIPAPITKTVFILILNHMKVEKVFTDDSHPKATTLSYTSYDYA